MKKLLLTLLLAVVSSSAMAEWVKISASQHKGGFTYYADPTTIRKSGNKVKMWSLFDFNSTEISGSGEKALSQMSQVEFYCKEEQGRMLYFSFHSENMGRGDLVHKENAPNLDWSPLPPGSVISHLSLFACGK